MIFLVSKYGTHTRELLLILADEGIEYKYFDNIIDLEKALNIEPDPDYIIFFHWSAKIPKRIYKTYECITVHTSNLPAGRGGTPLQNQILEGVLRTKVNLIETSDPVDSGGVYLQAPITLQGNLTDIWSTIAQTTAELIIKLLCDNPKPNPQTSLMDAYSRVTSNEIDKETDDIDYLYDQIRMVDMEGYPSAYINSNNLEIELSRAKLLEDGSLLCDAKIRISRD